MCILRRAFLLLPLLPLLTGCYSSSPLVNPYCCAPKASGQVWKPNEGNLKANASIMQQIPYTLAAQDLEETLTMTDLFHIALSNSPTTRQSWEMARFEAANYSVSKSDYFPNIDLEMQLNSNKQGMIFNNDFVMNDETEWGPLISLSYLLWDSGERSANVAMHLQALYRANWNHNESIQDVLKQVADDYYNYLYSKAKLAAYQEDLYDALEGYQAANQKLESGVADVSEMLQAKTYYLQRKVLLVQQETEVKNAYLKMANGLGIPAQIELKVKDFPAEAPIEKFSFVAQKLYDTARKMRPDVNAAKAELYAKKAALQKAKSMEMLKITGVVTGGENWYLPGHKDGGNYNATINFSLPLFRGYYYKNEIKKAEANVEKAESELRQIELYASKEVFSDFNSFEMSKEEVYLTKIYKEAAYEDFNAILANYKSGTNTIVDLLNASAAYADARSRFVSAKRDFFTSLIHLSFATGVLNDQFEDQFQTPKQEKHPRDSKILIYHE